MVETDGRSEWREFVEVAYRGVLRRAATAAELRDWTALLERGEVSPSALICELSKTPEHAATTVGGTYSWEHDARIASFRTPAADALSRRLRDDRPIDSARFDELWELRFHRELGPGAPEDALRRYGEDHRQRFFETVNAMAILLEGREQPRVLDFGISVFMWFYARLFPGIELVTSDRPVRPAQQEFFERASRDAGAVRHVPVDLADPGAWTDAVRTALGTFDLILVTEIIEHLPVHPVRVLRPLIEMLTPGGHIYVTTPNCYSRVRLWEVARRINIQPLFPYDGNSDGAHHYHEFAMPELLQVIADAGGVPLGFLWSDCWDQDQDIQPLDQRSNLVAVIGRATSAAPGS